MTASVNQQNDARERPEIDRRKQPISQSTGAPAIDHLTQRIGHDCSDADQAHESGDPAHRQPGSCQRFSKAVLPGCESNQRRKQDRDQDPTNMPGLRQRIALMNVTADGMSLIAKYQAQSLINFLEIRLGINAHQSPSRTIFLAGVSRARGTWPVE